MKATQLVKKCSRGAALMMAGALLGSLMVVSSVAPVSAEDSDDSDSVLAQAEGSVFAFVVDNNDCASYHSTLDTLVEVSTWNGSAWSRSTPEGFPTDELLSSVGSPLVFTGVVRDENGDPEPNAMVGTLMLTNLPGEGQPEPEIIAATCAITNSLGQYSVRALNVADDYVAPAPVSGKVANLGVSPQLKSANLSVPTLGSTSTRVTALSPTTVNFDLDHANVNWGSYVYDQVAGFDDAVTFPTSAYCVAASVPAPGTSLNVCGVSRGMSFTADVTHLDVVEYEIPVVQQPMGTYLRVYIDEDSSVLGSDPFALSGLTGDWEPANGRWSGGLPSSNLREVAAESEADIADAILSGSAPGDFFVDVSLGSDSPLDAAVPRTAVTGVGLSSQIWRNAITVPSTDASTIQITGFHKHRLGTPGEIVPNFRFLTVNSEDGGRTAFERVTSPRSQGGLADMFFLTAPFNGGGGGCGTPGTGNYSGIVLTDLDPATPYTGCGRLWAQPFALDAYGQGNPGWAWEPADGALESAVNASGHFGFDVPATGIYRLHFRPNSSREIPETFVVVRFTVEAGGVASVHACDSSFSLNPQGPEDASERCDDWVSLEASGDKYPFFAPPANVVGEVQLPNGQALASNARARVNVEKLVDGGFNWYFSGDGTGTETAAEGKFLVHLKDGRYSLRIESPQGTSYANIRVYLKVSTNPASGQQTIERCTEFDETAADTPEDPVLDGCTTLPAMDWDSPLELQFRSGDLVGQVVGAGYFWVEVQKKNTNLCETCYQPVPGGSANANDSGVFALTFESEGDYKLFLNPPHNGSAGATRSEVLVNVEIDGSTKTLTVTQNGAPVAPNGEGVYVFTFNTANFVVQVTDPQGDEVANSWVNLQSLEFDPRSNRYEFRTWIDAARTDADGKARMSLNTTGYYKLVANNPTTDPYPELVAYVKVVAGSPSAFYRCSDYQSQPVDRNADTEVTIDDALECSGTTSPANDATPFGMQFVGASFRGQVSGYANFWVELQQLNLSQCENCYEWIGGTVANQSGVFGFNFEETGTYRLVINPPWNDNTGATRTEVTVVVSEGVGGAFNYVVTRGGSTVSPTNGTYVFTLSSANFAAALKKSDGSAEPYPNASFERWNANIQQFEWSSIWANGNASGQFSASLSDGTWKITARPGFQSEGTATPSVVYAIVSNGEVTKVATSKTCVDTVGCAGISPAGSPPRYTLTLGSPNFTGFVGVSDEIGRNPATGQPSLATDAVSFSWIEVQPWNKFEQQYRWSSEISGVNTSSTGRFATTLPAGNSTSNPLSQYLVIVNPRPQDAAEGRSRGSFRVKVNAEGDVICEVEYVFCEAGEAPESGRFDLYLSGANLTGTVTAGETNVPNSNVRAERWNGQWFEWVNLWAQTGVGKNSGRFALNLDTAGTYKLTAEAPTWNNAFTGYANVSMYVRFDGDSVCVVDDQNDTGCNGDDLSTLDLTVALAGANVRGSVSSAAGAVRNGWVNVMRYNSTVGWWEWVTGVPVSNSGAFSISLAPSQDGDASEDDTQQRFKLEVMPPWGNSSLTRKEVQLWVGAVGQGAAGDNFYLVCSKAAVAGCTGAEADPQGPSDTLSVVLTSGNVTGTVTTDGTNGMANAWINVEKWTTPSWARSPMWQWVEVFANTNQAGIYNLDLEAQGEGHYRVTANPGWNNPDNLTRTSVVVYQAADGDVCEVTGPEDEDCDDAANPYDLDIQLAGANLVGTLKNGSDNVGFAWVGFLREQNNAGLTDGASRSNTWYEWLGGANTSATGTFGLRIESDGRYQLEVNPPWSTALTRFSVYLLAEDSDGDGIDAGDIRICASKSEPNDDCRDNAIWSDGSNSQLSFPAANVAIRVCSKDGTGTACTGVPNAWVNAFSGFEWIGGANTNSAGIARFSLPDGGDYRFEANPNWANPDGTRVETGGGIDVLEGDLVLATVTGSAVIATSDGQIDMRLGSPNVSGFVYYELDEVQTAMPWAYVGVRKNIDTNGSPETYESYEWLPGASADGSGRYRLALADGDYTLTAYPNPSVADRAPASISVTVTGGVISCTGAAVVDTCSIDFDAAPKNVNFVMSNMGTFTRTLYVYDSANNLVTTVSKPPVGGNVSVSFALPDGTYRLRVQALNTVATDGSTPIVDFSGPTGSACRAYAGLVVEGGAVTDQAALQAWAAGFNGNDATTGLECKA